MVWCALALGQDARQLRQVFGQLEENNLFLIQNAQESAEALEAAMRALQASNAQLDAEAAGLHRQAAALRAAIAAQQERARTLKVCRPFLDCPLRVAACARMMVSLWRTGQA